MPLDIRNETAKPWGKTHILDICRITVFLGQPPDIPADGSLAEFGFSSRGQNQGTVRWIFGGSPVFFWKKVATRREVPVLPPESRPADYRFCSSPRLLFVVRQGTTTTLSASRNLSLDILVILFGKKSLCKFVFFFLPVIFYSVSHKPYSYF